MSIQAGFHGLLLAAISIVPVMIYHCDMNSRFIFLFLILIVVYFFRERIRNSGIFRSAGRIFNVVFYIYLAAVVAAFIVQVFSNLF